MGFYGEQVFPRIMNVMINTKENRRIRERVCSTLAGDVVEIGFGTGHNLPFMPEAVNRIWAVDPLEKGRDLAAERIEKATCEVEFVGLEGEHLPLPDGVADAALSTWTMCSLDDPVAAIREIRRVLKPGGVLHFAEHGLAPDEKVRTWQHRCNGLQRRVAAGCNLNRDIPSLISEGGLSIEQLDTYYAKGDPKALGWTFEGRAVAKSS